MKARKSIENGTNIQSKTVETNPNISVITINVNGLKSVTSNDYQTGLKTKFSYKLFSKAILKTGTQSEKKTMGEKRQTKPTQKKDGKSYF